MGRSQWGGGNERLWQILLQVDEVRWLFSISHSNRLNGENLWPFSGPTRLDPICHWSSKSLSPFLVAMSDTGKTGAVGAGAGAGAYHREASHQHVNPTPLSHLYSCLLILGGHQEGGKGGIMGASVMCKELWTMSILWVQQGRVGSKGRATCQVKWQGGSSDH